MLVLTSHRFVLMDTDVNEQNVDEVECSPSTITRRISVRLGVSYTRAWWTSRMHGLYPYHLQRIQHLQAEMKVDYWNFVVGDVQIPEQSHLYSDEATFTRGGINDTHNSHLWSKENPHAIVESNFQERFSVKCVV